MFGNSNGQIKLRAKQKFNFLSATHLMTYNGWYAVKRNQPTNQPTQTVYDDGSKETWEQTGYFHKLSYTNTNIYARCSALFKHETTKSKTRNTQQ